MTIVGSSGRRGKRQNTAAAMADKVYQQTATGMGVDVNATYTRIGSYAGESSEPGVNLGFW